MYTLIIFNNCYQSIIKSITKINTVLTKKAKFLNYQIISVLVVHWNHLSPSS